MPVDFFRPVFALFVKKDSVYKTFPFVDCYDIDRNALSYPGGCPVVAHPPCRTWGKLRKFVTNAPTGEHDLGPWAIAQVRKFGGVVEHPDGSRLFRACKCSLPGEFPDEFGGWSIKIDQHRFGHLAEKQTILYIVGTDWIPKPPPKAGNALYWIGSPGASMRSRRPFRDGIKPSCPKSHFDSTPPLFASYLLMIARCCYVNSARF